MRAAAACAGVHRLELGAEPLLISDGPGLYPRRTACVWVLHAAAPIRLVFRSFFTEESDVFKVYDGAGETMQLIAELSGSRLPAPIASNGTVLTLTFTSGSSVRFSGFELFASSLAANGAWPPISAPARPPDPRTPLRALLVLPAIGAGFFGVLHFTMRLRLSQLAAALAAGQESVAFKCDVAKAAVSEACPPSGLLHWNCSEDCPDAECDINFGGLGLFGTIPEIGDLRCAHRFARV